MNSIGLLVCLLFTWIVTLQAIHNSSCFGFQISLCVRKFGLHGFCPYDFYLFLQEKNIKLCLDFNFPLLLVTFILFEPLLALSKRKILIIRIFDMCIKFLLQLKNQWEDLAMTLVNKKKQHKGKTKSENI